jgi:hypothetical protein
MKMTDFKDFIDLLRVSFHKRLDVKDQWSVANIKNEFDGAIAEAALFALIQENEDMGLYE